MKRKLNILLSACFLSVFFNTVNAQSIKSAHENGSPSLITFEKNKEEDHFKNRAKAASTSNNPMVILKQYLSLTAEDEFRVIKNTTDDLGYDHYKYQQYYKGVKVDFAIYNIHYKKGKLYAINGEYQAIQDLNVIPGISEEKALNNALGHVNATQYVWESFNTKSSRPKGELIIVKTLSEEDKITKLTYKFNIEAVSPNYHSDVYVDAHTGKVVLENSKIHNYISEDCTYSKQNTVSDKKMAETIVLREDDFRFATGQGKTWYSGLQSIESSKNANGKYILNDETRKIRTQKSDGTDFISDTSSWFLNAADSDTKRGALDAHWGSGKTYDYFLDEHNWQSYGNNRMSPSAINITMLESFDASYSGRINLGIMNFFPNDPRPMGALDIVAHEYTHAVIDHSADLNYAHGTESSALNEGISDVFGAVVEHHFFPNRQNWVNGESIIVPAWANAGIIGTRNLEDPKVGNLQGNHPNTYKGEFWQATGNNAHRNSTIVSHWFYLLSEGKSGTNDQGIAYNVTGIGIDKATDVIFRALTRYMTPNTDYKTARTLTIQAATDLYNANSQEVTQVKNAWDAVGVYNSFFNVTSPTLNEELLVGTTKEITWQQSEDYPRVDIKLSTDGGGSYPITIATNIANTGSFTFTVPKQTGDENKVMVVASNSSSSAISVGISPKFKINICSDNPTNIKNFPYTLNFENRLQNWTIHYVDGNPFPWHEASFGEWKVVTRSINSYGPSTPVQGTHYLQSRVTEGNSYITSPFIQVTQNNLKLLFDFYLDQDLSEATSFGPDPNRFKVQVTTDGGQTWTTELNLRGTSSNSRKWFNNYMIDLRQYEGNCIKIRFNNSGSVFQGGLQGVFTLDNIRIQTSAPQAKSNDIVSRNQITLFPNPVNDQLNITIPQSIGNDQLLYSISNITGVEITNGTFRKTSNRINVSQLPKGVYFISINGDKEVYAKKFVKK